MLKRLIEVALPLEEVSEQSAREKSIRHGHISTLHIWWARRPLAACRAAVFASLIPDPDDPECPESFRVLVNEVLKESEFKPKNGDGSATKDTSRNRCLEFIKQLVKWENSNKPHYIEPARKLIAAAHKILHPKAEGDAPKVLDPFAGGGAIPLEALRLGCEAHAVDINPVAHLIQLCTLVYPQKYSQPNSRPVPEYIKRLIAHNKARNVAKGTESRDLFDKGDTTTANDGLIPDTEITETEYTTNPLRADVKYWGHWVLEKARLEIGKFYQLDKEGGFPSAYLWARTVKCPNPTCGATIPLLRQLWLQNKGSRKVALKMRTNGGDKQASFEVSESRNISFDPSIGTTQRANASCPFCRQTCDADYIKAEGNRGRIGQQMLAVVLAKPEKTNSRFRNGTENDDADFVEAARYLKKHLEQFGKGIVPDEPTPDHIVGGGGNCQPYGIKTFGEVFNARQLLVLTTFVRLIRQAGDNAEALVGKDYANAIRSLLSCAFGRLVDYNSSLCRWVDDFVADTFARPALSMVWDYCEAVPFSETSGNWEGALNWEMKVLTELQGFPRSAVALQGSAASLPVNPGSLEAIITDPPYYDSVGYAILSDFFYVWHKRVLHDIMPAVFRLPLTPKTQEIIADAHRHGSREKAARYYEEMMGKAFLEMAKAISDDGVALVMFAHKSSAAWDTIIAGLLQSGLFVTASWPFHTERPGRMMAIDAAALAGSISLICRKRSEKAGSGLWDDVRKELKDIAKERLDFFWSQGIRGADFFISAIGPALSVFGKYERVTKLTGDEVTVGQFLDEVRSLVTNYALAKIMKTVQTVNIDSESQFYIVWKWSYADAKVPADESFKLAQALRLGTETMWDRTGVLEKSGENVQAMPVVKRMKVKDLGEPTADGTPASLIDVLHRLCVFRDKGDTQGLIDFLARSRQGRNPNLWLVAQAVSEILPDGDKEKQLMQGLLNQRDQVEEEARKGKLF